MTDATTTPSQARENAELRAERDEMVDLLDQFVGYDGGACCRTSDTGYCYAHDLQPCPFARAREILREYGR